VIDACCGTGSASVAAMLSGKASVAFDVDPRAVERARDRLRLQAERVRTEPVLVASWITQDKRVIRSPTKAKPAAAGDPDGSEVASLELTEEQIEAIAAGAADAGAAAAADAEGASSASDDDADEAAE
jgi:hypothetical protein